MNAVPDASGAVLADEEAVALAADELAAVGGAPDGGGLVAVGAPHQVHPPLRHADVVLAHAARHSQRELLVEFTVQIYKKIAHIFLEIWALQ